MSAEGRDPFWTFAEANAGLWLSGANLLLRGEKPHLFLLGHSHGTDWVQYNSRGWLGHARHSPAAQNAATLLQDSQK